MDTDVLVDDRIEDGRRLVTQLVRDRFEVRAAFWVKTSEESLWQLCIASPLIDAAHLGDAYSTVFAALGKTPDCSVTPSELKLLNITDPIVREVIAVRDRYSSRKPLPYRGKRLGTLAIEEAVIYPVRFPLETRELPDGSWEVLISEADDVCITCESKSDAQLIAHARVLEHEALARLKTGLPFAAELEKTADAMEKYRMGFGSRFLRSLAQDFRR